MPGMSDQRPDVAEQLDAMQRRLDLLERENERLREKLDPMLGPDNPCFHPQLFLRVLRRNLTLPARGRGRRAEMRGR